MATGARTMRGVAGTRTLTLPDQLLGIAGGAMILAAIVLLISTLVRGGGPEIAAPPAIQLLSPADGDVVDHPLELRFSSGAPLTRGPGGFGVGPFHLHAAIDGTEIMPAPTDIRLEGDGVYRWTLPQVGAGEVRVGIFWSDEAHRPIGASGTGEIRVRVR